MDRYYYLIFILFSLVCLYYLDYKKKLVFFAMPRKSAVVLVVTVVFFLLWDTAGVALGIFSTNQRFVSGLNLGHPDLPIEEVFFLTLISYVTLLIWRWRFS